jgi:hypothetical protein
MSKKRSRALAFLGVIVLASAITAWMRLRPFWMGRQVDRAFWRGAALELAVSVSVRFGGEDEECKMKNVK